MYVGGGGCLETRAVGGVEGFPTSSTQVETEAGNPISDSDGVDAQPY